MSPSISTVPLDALGDGRLEEGAGVEADALAVGAVVTIADPDGPIDAAGEAVKLGVASAVDEAAGLVAVVGLNVP